MPDKASDLAHRLGRQAEAVCSHYLSNGRREGRYWLVGDVRNTPGRSMFVRLKGAESGKGAAGKWTDYVAPEIMLRPRARRPFCAGSAASAQHNLGTSGRVA
ncbi:MAG: hypothetical protein J0G95_06930 [Rhizobiales bacterium]|nr:hypothetical protein [Hyphomicrobiales bacterium]